MRRISKRTAEEELQIMRDYVSTLTVEQVKNIVQTVMGAPHRELTGDEYDHVWLMLQMMEPSSSSNNQHSWTDIYIIGNQDQFTEYHVTFWPRLDDPIEELPTITIIGEQK